MSYLIDRLYSATVKSENHVLDQIKHDIELAKQNKELNTEEYKIIVDGKDIMIKDKIHNEFVKVTASKEGFRMNDVPVDQVHKDTNKVFSNMLDYYTNNNELIMIGNGSPYSRIQRLFSNCKLDPTFNIDGYKVDISKSFSNLSVENQRHFTKLNRRYAVIDKNDKLKCILDINEACAMIKREPDLIAMKESVYRKSIQDKLRNFSNSTKELILNKIFTAVENC